jgi:type II secretory pathway pseudopilin PulG
MKINGVAERLGKELTLVEVLLVIAVIAVLVLLVLPNLASIDGRAPRKIALLEASQIVQAIKNYEAEYGKFPVSSDALRAVAGSGEDFTFGTHGLPHGLKTPSGSYDVRALDAAGKPLSYQANNSEVMAVLLDVEAWPSAPKVPTINQGHVMNPQKLRFLNAAMAANTTSPGIGQDGVYRDPWGQPYIITIDLNKDGKARDVFYREPSVSADPSDTNTPKRGLNGLIPTVVGGRTFYEVNSPLAIWSPGPDKMVDPGPGVSANQGPNRDNIVSWK